MNNYANICIFIIKTNVLFRLRKRTKKRGEFGFSPHPLKPPLAKHEQGVDEDCKNKRTLSNWGQCLFFCFFVLAICHFDLELRSVDHWGEISIKPLLPQAKKQVKSKLNLNALRSNS